MPFGVVVWGVLFFFVGLFVGLCSGGVGVLAGGFCV